MKLFATIVAALVMFFAMSIAPTPAALVFVPSLVSPDAITFVIVGTVISQEPMIYRDGIPSLLRETLGVRLGKSTISKLFSPAIGQGCEPACYWNKRPLYRPSDVIAWAKSRLRPGPGMMTPQEMPADGILAESGSAARTDHEESLTA